MSRILIFSYLVFWIGFGALPGEHSRQSPEAPALREPPPNILFCIADDASLEYLGAYGCPWVRTPAFDRVAREGLLFTNAYTPNAKCAPSRACILTGRNPWQLEEAGNHVPFFPARFTTYAEALARHGYRVGYTGKGWAPGNPGQLDGRPRQLTGPVYNQLKTATPTKAISPTDYAANLEAFLKDKPKDQPFCFWYGGNEPHRAYEYGSGAEKGKKKLSDIDRVPAYWPDNDTVRHDMLDYAFEVEYFDYHLGRMLDVLEKAGQLENTVVVVTSDNGMPFPRVKGHVYAFDNHLPLAVMWQKGIRNPGRKVDPFVSFIDFAPTFLELAGLPAGKSGMQPITGKSLLDLMRATPDKAASRPDYVLLGRERTDVGRPGDAGYPVRGIVTEKFIYTRNYEPDRWPAGNPETGYLDTDGSPTKTLILQQKRRGETTKYWDLAFGKKPAEELYQLDQDPYCLDNLAANPAFAATGRRLREQMEKQLINQQDPRMSGKGHLFDQYPYSEAATRGFYERYMRGEPVKAGWVNESDFEKRKME